MRKPMPGLLRADDGLVDLSPEEVRRLPKPRDGFEQHVEAVMALYEGHGAALAIPGVRADGVRAQLVRLAALRQQEKTAREQLQMVAGTRLFVASTLWTTLLEVYARARAVGRTNEAVRRSVEDFARFLKKPRRVTP
jgi:hypothetical protein